MESLKKFFYPKSICIVGASSKEKSIGYELLKNIRDYGYKGKIFPVNPKADEILSYKCYHTVEEISEKIDLAIVVVPKHIAEESIISLLNKNIKSIILVTAGFKEIGKEGEELESRILKLIKNSCARLVGPNCMGVINTLDEIKLNATFVAEKPEIGSTGFLSQSGALGAAVLNSLRETDIKFAHFISVGNKADVNENDILEFWQEDKNVKTIALYLESFVDGESFIKKFIERKIDKPVIVLKAGRTQSGMKAAISHTGAMSTTDKIVDAVLNQFGIIRAENLNELFNTAKGFENFPMPKGNKIAVVTNAGGPAILCADKIEKEGLILSSLSKETKEKLRKIIHPEGSVENPIDLLPNGDAQTFKNVIETIIQDENVDAVISIFVEPIMVSAFDVIEKVNSLQSSKPIFQVAMPLPEFWQYYRNNSKYKLPIFRNPEDPPEVISNMLFYFQKSVNQNKHLFFSSSERKDFAFQSNHVLNNSDIEKLFSQYGIPLVQSKICLPDDLKNIELNFYPLVLKGLSKNLIHKTEAKAVALNIKNMEELLTAARNIENNLTQSGYELEQFLIQKYIKPMHEILIGGYRDASFGPIIMFGLGGKYVEVFDDVSIKSCYLSDEDVEEMIASTKIGKILSGVRNEKFNNINELKRIIKSCAKMMIENPSIKEFDINPLIIDSENNLYAVDVRIKMS
ncbi:MAG: acetate--CoA ligase family protein [Melioribacteraceae bacterium]